MNDRTIPWSALSTLSLDMWRVFNPVRGSSLDG